MIFDLKWVGSGVKSWPISGWTFQGYAVVCRTATDLLGWPGGEDVKVKVSKDAFPGSHHIVLDRDALEDGGHDEYPLTVDGIHVDDHYWRVTKFVNMYAFHVGLV